MRFLTCDAVAPATGTPETGGWTTRELRTIIRGLEGINLIATDIVEVAPAYDTNAELTTMAAAVSGHVETKVSRLIKTGCSLRSHDSYGQEGSAELQGCEGARGAA